MQTFLIISKDKKSWESYVKDFQNKQKVDNLDCTFLSQEGSFGIENVRNLQKTIILKPFKSKEKIIIIENFQTATLEAQNAMLKILEEPPANTIIFLLTDSIGSVIPTVQSRTFVINLLGKNVNKKINEEPKKEEVLKILKMNIEEKLVFAQEKSKEKNTATEYVENLLFGARDLLLEKPSVDKIVLLEEIQKSYVLLKESNVNTRLLLENCFLNFPALS